VPTVDVEVLNAWNFSVFDYTLPQLVALAVSTMQLLGLDTVLGFKQIDLMKFVVTLAANYNVIPYHRFEYVGSLLLCWLALILVLRHAFDVFHACYIFLQRCGGKNLLKPIEMFALLLSALIHDVDHPGLNNTFMENTNHPLAIKYNYRSILENHHGIFST